MNILSKSSGLIDNSIEHGLYNLSLRTGLHMTRTVSAAEQLGLSSGAGDHF